MSTHNHIQKIRVFTKAKGLCFYCGKALDIEHGYYSDAFVLDHVIPKSRGGTDGDENRVASCVSCNSGKRDKNLEEYRYFIMSKLGMSFTNAQREYWKTNHNIQLPDDVIFVFPGEK